MRSCRLLSALCAAGCNAVFGIDDLAGGETAGGGAAAPSHVASSSAAGGGAGHAGNAGAGGDANVACGDGVLADGEECDDGNSSPGDGCDGACVVECGAGPAAIKDPATFHCYIANLTQLAWLDARDACLARGRAVDLVAVSSQAERDFLAPRLVGGFTGWTGGNDLAVEGDYAWSNGEPWGFAPWAAARPNGSGDCVLGASDGTLADADCGTAQYSLCERTPAGR